MPSPAFYPSKKYPPYDFNCFDYVIIHCFESTSSIKEAAQEAKMPHYYNFYNRLKRIKKKLGCSSSMQLRIMIRYKNKEARWGVLELFKDINYGISRNRK